MSAPPPPPGFGRPQQSTGTPPPPAGFKRQLSLREQSTQDLPAPLRYLTEATDVAQDVFTRGLGSKLFGEKDMLEREREHLGPTGTVAASIPAAIAGAPYRVGSTLAGAGFGALEGGVSAYGDQKDWTPDLAKIGIGALEGAGLGAGGAKLGEWGGKLFGDRVPNIDQSRGWVKKGLDAGGHILQGGDTPLGQSAMAIATGGYGPAISRAMRWLGGPAATRIDPAAGAASRDALAKMLAGIGT